MRNNGTWRLVDAIATSQFTELTVPVPVYCTEWRRNGNIGIYKQRAEASLY